jgi:outer membrane lipoprotein-sorting protein
MKTPSGLIAAAVLLACVDAASAQSATDIVEKHLAASGGRAALGKLTSRVVTGNVTLTSPAGDLSGTIEVTNEAPNKERMLITLDLTNLGAGQFTFEQRFDGQAGYVVDPLQGNRPMTSSQIDALKNQSFPDALLDYEKRGMTVSLGGKEKVGERDAYVLVLQPKTGSPVRQYIDAESFLIIRVRMTVDSPETGQIEQTVDFLDHRDVDGIKFPFQVKTTNPAQTVSATITKVQHNTAIDQSIFVKPAN